MASDWIIRPVSLADAAGVWHLLRLVGWVEQEGSSDADGFPPDWVAGLIAGSEVIEGAFDGERLIGMARALSDGRSDAFVQDVTVDPAWRGRGIGSALVRRVVEALDGRGVDWIGLVATPGHEEFYRRLGFDVLKNHTPMRWARRQADTAR